MENDYSKLKIEDLTLLLLITCKGLARRIRDRSSSFTQHNDKVSNELMNDMRNIRMQIRQQVAALGEKASSRLAN